MIKQLITLMAFVAFAAGCSVPGSVQKNEPVQDPKPSSAAPANAEAPVKTEEANAPKPADQKAAVDQNKADCLGLKQEYLVIDEKQTFSIDFPPFGRSCFAVFHDPEFDDPPLNSSYFIYKDGKQVFEFPEQFNGTNVGCWVEAVSFEDMNGDGLNDIAIAGKCSAKSKPYPENMVYINTGKDFKTNVQANMEMMDFTEMTQIRQYVKEHQSLFAR